MSALGQSLDRAQDNYRQAMNKLSQGRGNLIGQVEGFRSLGVEVKRPINPIISEQALAESSSELAEKPTGLEDYSDIKG